MRAGEHGPRAPVSGARAGAFAKENGLVAGAQRAEGAGAIIEDGRDAVLAVRHEQAAAAAVAGEAEAPVAGGRRQGHEGLQRGHASTLHQVTCTAQQSTAQLITWPGVGYTSS